MSNLEVKEKQICDSALKLVIRQTAVNKHCCHSVRARLETLNPPLSLLFLVQVMLPTFLALALFLVTSTNALSLDSSVHLARHQHIAARHAVERSPVNARCKKRNPPSSVSPSTPASSSQALPPSSSSSQAPSPSSSPSSGPRKAGIGWSQGPNAAALQNFITGKVSSFVDLFLYSSSCPYLFLPSIYTWGPTKPPLIEGLTFAPMLWGEDQISQFQSLVKPGYAKVALAFNERVHGFHYFQI